ncbi:hypothetical protein BUALT_Bualt02G0065100 [Buddleja alternifolia]|uniref:Uncharacterized protein n=1 Tax=Buddleja alternifolia TaxID=168488 RepID=A0AAV6Y276_9LAMI|nr:hypothetical protein BUALT_Bualt02G0065100 [Buddleja alternifolia]
MQSECSDFWDSEYMDSEVEGEMAGERGAAIPTETAAAPATAIVIEPIPIAQHIVEREPSSDSEDEESEDLVNRVDKFSSGKILTVKGADLGIEKPDAFTVVSDKEKGLIPTFELVFPGAENRFYVRHLHENFKKAEFRGLAFKLALWNATKATTLPEYELRTKEMGLLDESVVECSILEAREKPILTMLEWIREYLMIRLTENRDKAKKRWGEKQICPKIRKTIEKNMEKSAKRLGADEPRDKGRRDKGRKVTARMKKQSFRVQCHYCENPGHNQMGCKRRKTDIAAGLTRDFAAPINTNVENANGNDAGPSKMTKAPPQKRRRCTAQKGTTSAAKQAITPEYDNRDPSTPAQLRQVQLIQLLRHCSVLLMVHWGITSSNEGPHQPKLTARKRTFSKMGMATAARPPRTIAAPVRTQFRPPSVVMGPAPKPTPVPQPRVNIRCPLPFAPNHPILSQTPTVNS